MTNVVAMILLGYMQQPSTGAGSRPAAGVPWRRSFDEAGAEARQSGKLAVLYFYADWCQYSRKLDAETLSDPRVQALLERFVPCRVDYERQRPLVRRFRVMEHPQLVFVDGEGNAVDRLTGYFAPDEYLKEMRRHIEYLCDRPELEKRLAAHPEDGEALSRMAVIFAERNEYEIARKYLERAERADPQDAEGLRARAYSAFARKAEDDRDAPQTVQWLLRSLAAAKDPTEQVALRLKLSEAYFSQHKIDDTRGQLIAILAMPGAPDETKKRAKQYLDYMDRQEAKQKLATQPVNGSQPASQPESPTNPR